MTPRSVLLVTPRWTRDGGVATHVVASATELARHGLEVHVLAARLELSEEIDGVTLHRSPELFDTDASPRSRIGSASSLLPDVIHSHQFEDPEVLEELNLIAPVAVSVHGYSACASGVHYFRPGQECTRAHGAGCIPNLLLRGCAHSRNPVGLPSSYRRAARSLRALQISDLVISYSSVIDAHLAAAGLERRARVPLFPTVAPQLATGHANRRRVVFAGRIVAPKGVDVLIRAARAVSGEFVVCGDGRQLDGLRRLAQQTGVEDRVRFAGWLSATDLASELAEASILAMPSRWPEPAGLVGLEAQAAGRPVVASDTGGVRDWLEHGVNGLYVTPGEPDSLAAALNALLDDPDRQHTMGDAGRRIVSERYTPGSHVRALLEAYTRAHQAWSHRRSSPSNATSGRRPANVRA